MLLFSTILSIKESMSKDDFIRLAIEWNQGSTHPEDIIQGIDWQGERNIRFGTDYPSLAIEEYRNENIIAIRYEKKENSGTIWTTDYVMNFNSRKMSIRLDRSYTENALDPDARFSTPHFITMLIERGYLEDDCGLPVHRTAFEIDETNISLLAEVINEQTCYKLPVVYVSKTYYDEDPVNVAILAGRLKGAAHVMVQKASWLNQQLRTLCNDKNEYYGAIGIYYPAKAIGHRKYLYRSAIGYDSFLLEKVIKSVIQYSNSQMVDTLFTWQGVNNALLRDRLISQREERIAAEKAKMKAEEEKALLLENMDEEERRIHKEAMEEAKFEADTILESFDEDMQRLQNQIDELTRANEQLQIENQGLRAKLESLDSVPVLYMGDEFEFYPGEIKDLLLTMLSESAKSSHPKSRRGDIARDIIRNNDYKKLTVKKAEALKNLLHNYNGMSGRTRQGLKDLGFEITEEGKHYKVTYYGDGRYQTTYAKTPSDVRSGINSAQQTINIVF